MRTFLSFGQTVGILRLFRVRLANVSATYAESIINDFANELMPKYNDLMDGIFKDKQTQTETRRISLESQLEQETDPAKISELKTKINTEKNLSASYGRILSSQRLHIRPVDIRSFIPSEVIDYLDSLIDSAGPDQEGEVQAKIKETLSGLFRALWSDWDTISTYIEAHPDDGKNKIKNVLHEAAQLIYTKPEPKTQEDVYSTSISEIRSILGNIRKNYYSLFDESSIILQFIEAMLKGGICSNIINTSEEGIKNIEALHDGLLGSIIGELNAKRFLLKSSDARQELVSKIRTAFFEVLRSASSFENINNLLSYLRQVVKNTVKKGMEETGVEYKRVYRNDYDAYSDLMHKKLMHEKNKGGKLSKKEESRLRAAEKEILKNFRQKYLKEYRSTFENAQEAEAAAEAAAQEHLNNIKIEKRSRVTLRGESLEDLTSDSGDAEINPFQPTEGLSDIIYGTPGSLKPSSVKDDPVFLQIMRKHYEDMKGAAVNADPSVPKIIKEAMWDLIIKENAASFKTQPGAIKSLIPNLKKMVQRHPSFNHLSKQESDDVDKYFRSTGGKTVGNKISQLLTNMSDSVSNQMRQSLTSEELKILEEEWAGADQADLLKSRFLQRGNYLDRVVDDTIKKGLKEEENVQGT
ncbi:MAG: hypothetical protein EBR67_10525, partial [Proteobacteria bacterium]|nr:hypothetical protein [Pseudomonadota bacterium]